MASPARFLHSMGVASIIAGFVLIGLGALTKKSKRAQRMLSGKL